MIDLRSIVQHRLRRGAAAIGIDLAPEGLRMVQFAAGPEGPRLLATAMADGLGPEPTPALLREQVRDALRTRGFCGRRVISALPPSDVKVMIVNFQASTVEPEPLLILRLVAERVSEPLEELVVDYLPIRMIDEESGDRSAIVALSQRDVVIAHLERLRVAGLSVEALDIRAAAIRRVAVASLGNDPERNHLIVYCGRERSQLTVLWGRRWAFHREVDFGERQLGEAVAKALDMEPVLAGELIGRYGVWPPEPGLPSSCEGRAVTDVAAELEYSQTLMEIVKPCFYALAEQVDAAMVYTASRFRGATVNQIHVMGPGIRWPRAERLLESLVSLPARRLDQSRLFANAALGSARNPFDPSREADGLEIATGLALRGVTDGA